MAFKSNMHYWDGYYTGDVAFFTDRPNGFGTYYEGGREKYKGEWSNGDYHGRGTYYWDDGAYVEGNFSHGAITSGTVVYKNGDRVTGKMSGRNGKFILDGRCMCQEPYSSYSYPVLFDHGRFVKKL